MIWVRAIALPPDQLGLLPQPGEEVIVIGCGASHSIGDSIAYLRNDPKAPALEETQLVTETLFYERNQTPRAEEVVKGGAKHIHVRDV